MRLRAYAVHTRCFRYGCGRPVLNSDRLPQIRFSRATNSTGACHDFVSCTFKISLLSQWDRTLTIEQGCDSGTSVESLGMGVSAVEQRSRQNGYLTCLHYRDRAGLCRCRSHSRADNSGTSGAVPCSSICLGATAANNLYACRAVPRCFLQHARTHGPANLHVGVMHSHRATNFRALSPANPC